MRQAPNGDRLQAAWKAALDSEDRVTGLRIQTIVDGLGRAALASTVLESDAQPEDGEGDAGQQTGEMVSD